MRLVFAIMLAILCTVFADILTNPVNKDQARYECTYLAIQGKAELPADECYRRARRGEL